jgi:general secretion pathway protein I
MTRTRGFTLVEVLVALALLAVALGAGMRALAQAADGTGTLKARTLASWVAQDRLARLQVDPAVAVETRGNAVQAGTTFVWEARFSGTPNPAFRRVDITVGDPTMPGYALARLTGYLRTEPR